MAEPLSNEEKAALAAAKARALQLWGENGDAWRESERGPYFVGIVDPGSGNKIVSKGETWEEAFAIAEVNSAPGLVAQLHARAAEIASLKAELATVRQGASEAVAWVVPGARREKALLHAARTVVTAGLDGADRLVCSEDFREKLLRLHGVTARYPPSVQAQAGVLSLAEIADIIAPVPAPGMPPAEGATKPSSDEEKAVLAAAQARADQLWGDLGHAWTEPAAGYCVGLYDLAWDANTGRHFAFGVGASFSQAFAAAELRCAPGLVAELAEVKKQLELAQAELAARGNREKRVELHARRFLLAWYLNSGNSTPPSEREASESLHAALPRLAIVEGVDVPPDGSRQRISVDAYRARILELAPSFFDDSPQEAAARAANPSAEPSELCSTCAYHGCTNLRLHGDRFCPRCRLEAVRAAALAVVTEGLYYGERDLPAPVLRSKIRALETALGSAATGGAPDLAVQLAARLAVSAETARDYQAKLEHEWSRADAAERRVLEALEERDEEIAKTRAAEEREKALREAATAMVAAGLRGEGEWTNFLPTRLCRDALLNLRSVLLGEGASPAEPKKTVASAPTEPGPSWRALRDAARDRASALWGDSGDVWLDDDGPVTGHYVVGLRRPGSFFDRLGRGESWEKAFDAAEVRCAPGIYLRLVDATAVNNRLRSTIRELEDALHRDKTGLAAALGAIRAEVNGRAWVAEGRGPYEWDDDRYKAEAGDALRTVAAMAEKALQASGDLVRMTLNRGPARVSEEGRELAAVIDRVREAGAWLAAAGFDDSPAGCGPVHRMLARLKTALRLLSSYENEKHRGTRPPSVSIPEATTVAEARAAAMAAAAASGPVLSYNHKTWVEGRDPDRKRILLGGLGVFGVGTMWCNEEEHHKSYLGYAEAPIWSANAPPPVKP